MCVCVGYLDELNIALMSSSLVALLILLSICWVVFFSLFSHRIDDYQYHYHLSALEYPNKLTLVDVYLQSSLVITISDLSAISYHVQSIFVADKGERHTPARHEKDYSRKSRSRFHTVIAVRPSEDEMQMFCVNGKMQKIHIARHVIAN